MINGKKLVVVMPAYNAAQTLVKTYEELPHEIVDEVILVDDHSRDHTIEVASKLGITTIIRHDQNLGYGGNQKTCYTAALESGADIVVMVHPDYQYSPRLCGAISWMIASGEYDMVMASRILGRGALKGGMPIWKYIANRFLTAFENIFVDVKLSEYHTGYRAFTRQVLETLPLQENSDDFVFDNQMIAQAVAFGFNLGEISCPTRYMPEASSINFRRSVKYGFGVLGTSLSYRLHKWGIVRSPVFEAKGRKLEVGSLQKRGQVIAPAADTPQIIAN
jgi:glycosyltransferase involved in cell wall biosynthesis